MTHASYICHPREEPTDGLDRPLVLRARDYPRKLLLQIGEVVFRIPDIHIQRRYKLLNIKDVEEALATAKENGLLMETGYRVDENGELLIDYQITEFGRDMVLRYLN